MTLAKWLLCFKLDSFSVVERKEEALNNKYMTLYVNTEVFSSSFLFPEPVRHLGVTAQHFAQWKNNSLFSGIRVLIG